MSDSLGRAANLWQICNSKITVLNAHLTEYTNEFYTVPMDPSPEHIDRMMGDLDHLMQEVDVEDEELLEAYRGTRHHLDELRTELLNIEVQSQHDSTP